MKIKSLNTHPTLGHRMTENIICFSSYSNSTVVVPYASHGKSCQPFWSWNPSNRAPLLHAEQLFSNSPAKQSLRARCNVTVMWHLWNIQNTAINKRRGSRGYGHWERICQWIRGMKIFRCHTEAELMLNSKMSPRQTDAVSWLQLLQAKFLQSAPFICWDASSGLIICCNYQILMLIGVINLTNGRLGESNTVPEW